MTDLVAFLRARVQEDRGTLKLSPAEATSLEGILTQYEQIDAGDRMNKGALTLHDILRSLAMIWRGHPDFRSEWVRQPLDIHAGDQNQA